MLVSARRHYTRQAVLAQRAAGEARRQHNRAGLVRTAAVYQAAAARMAFDATPDVLSEQGLDAPAAGSPAVLPLLTSGPLVAQMVDKVDAGWQLDRLFTTLVADAGRTATQVDMVSRPALTGHVRHLSPPSCSRCAVLAGRVYRWSTGFQRHPGCDCLMVPTTSTVGEGLVTSPRDAFNSGQVTGLSKSDVRAVNAGADLGQVVNVRRRAAGLRYGGSVAERAGRVTPAGILSLASDRDDAIRLLRVHGYIL